MSPISALQDEYLNGEKAIITKWPILLAIKWVFDKVGLPLILILFGMGAWSGAIPSPLSDLAMLMNQQTQVLIHHSQQTERLIEVIEARYSASPGS